MYRYKKSVHIKDKKIDILQTQTIKVNGFTKVELVPLYTNLWAYYRQASGDEIYAAAQIKSKVEVVFEINWRDNIDTTMKIGYKGKVYDITRIDDFEGGKNDLKIYAYRYGND